MDLILVQPRIFPNEERRDQSLPFYPWFLPINTGRYDILLGDALSGGILARLRSSWPCFVLGERYFLSRAFSCPFAERSNGIHEPNSRSESYIPDSGGQSLPTPSLPLHRTGPSNLHDILLGDALSGDILARLRSSWPCFVLGERYFLSRAFSCPFAE